MLLLELVQEQVLMRLHRMPLQQPPLPAPYLLVDLLLLVAIAKVIVALPLFLGLVLMAVPLQAVRATQQLILIVADQELIWVTDLHTHQAQPLAIETQMTLITAQLLLPLTLLM